MLLLTKSKSVVRSIKATQNDFCCSRHFSRSWCSQKIMSTLYWPVLKPHPDPRYTREAKLGRRVRTTREILCQRIWLGKCRCNYYSHYNHPCSCRGWQTWQGACLWRGSLSPSTTKTSRCYYAVEPDCLSSKRLVGSHLFRGLSHRRDSRLLFWVPLKRKRYTTPPLLDIYNVIIW